MNGKRLDNTFNRGPMMSKGTGEPVEIFEEKVLT